MNKISLTPSKTVSAGSFVILIFLLLFGIGFAVLVGDVLSENDASPVITMFFFLFIIMWIGTVLFMLIYHAKNFKSEKGISLMDINTELDISNTEMQRNPAERLRNIESLKKSMSKSVLKYWEINGSEITFSKLIQIDC
jgi:hypothetical protein